MTYIILAAGKGTRLNPITLATAKPLFRLDGKTTIIQRMIGLIKKYDRQAEVVVVGGFMRADVESVIEGASFIYNPFYAVTNSIASLWFARESLTRGGHIAILNADIVAGASMVKEVITQPAHKPTVLIDTSVKRDGDYNVRIDGANVVVMSKDLIDYDGEYAGVTLLDPASAAMLRAEVENMVIAERYNEWYENALVQLILKDSFLLYYNDISDYKWTEVDCVDDLLLAKTIHRSNE